MNARVETTKVDRSETIVIGRSPTGRGFRLEASQWLPCAREQVFAFFADAFQLETATPAFLKFSVLTPAPIHMQCGTQLDYRLRVRGVPMRWQSRISVWEPSERFVDEQIRGPYRRWYHEHVFETRDGGTLCRDVVDYEVPGGPLIHRLFVRGDLLKIFAYRQRKFRQLFGGDEP